MNFIEQLKALSASIPKKQDAAKNEEATKNAFVIPFIQALGYDPCEPTEVWPEYDADVVGVKKKHNEKVDYALLRDGQPIIFIECKWHRANLDHDESYTQLYRYFDSPDVNAHFAILTNGIKYQFYADLEHGHKLDKEPFLEFDMREIDENIAKKVEAFSKTSFNADDLLKVARNLKYTRKIQQFIANQYDNPSEEFVRFCAGEVYTKNLTQKLLPEFAEFTKRAFHQFITDRFNERWKKSEMVDVAESKESQHLLASLDQAASPTDHEDSKTGPTEEELEGYCIIKAILLQVVDPNRLAWRIFKNHVVGVLLDDNRLKPICKFWFNASGKFISVYDGNNKEAEPIQAVNDIFKFSEKLKASIANYESGKLPGKDLVLTASE